MSAAAQDVLSAPARTALDELLATPKVQSYASYEGSRGKCFEAALTAAVWFRAHGVPVRIVRFAQARVITPYSREELLAADDWTAIHRVQLASGITIDLTASELYHLRRLEQHAVQVEGQLIDLTWRSWEPESSFPRIATVEEYERDFTVDETICPDCGTRPEQFEPCVHPSAVVEAAFVRWLTHAEPEAEFVANTYLSHAEKLLAIRLSYLKKLGIP